MTKEVAELRLPSGQCNVMEVCGQKPLTTIRDAAAVAGRLYRLPSRWKTDAQASSDSLLHMGNSSPQVALLDVAYHDEGGISPIMQGA